MRFLPQLAAHTAQHHAAFARLEMRRSSVLVTVVEPLPCRCCIVAAPALREFPRRAIAGVEIANR